MTSSTHPESRFGAAPGSDFRQNAARWLCMAGAAAAGWLGAFQSPVVRAVTADEVIYSFGVPPANPIGELVETGDGVFYGTTSGGGAYGAGTIFKLTAGGVMSTVVEFSDAGLPNRGAAPGAGLLLATDGTLYGTTSRGGSLGLGTVFKLSAGKLTTLAEFSGNGSSNRGASPYATLVMGLDGSLYGTTVDGGYSQNGTVFKITPAGKLTTLVEFTGINGINKGASPFGGLVQDIDGTFYGTTSKGGAKGFGTLFKITPAGALTTLLEFSDNGALNKDAAPYSTLVFGPDRLLFGTTARGGLKAGGTAFKVTKAGELTTLAQFSGKSILPESALVPGADGAFYGTTFGDGLKDGGAVYRLGVDGALSVVARFTGKSGLAKGGLAQGALIKGKDNNLYGTTFSGGAADAGTVFKITADGTLTTLAEFCAPNAAANVQPALVRAAGGDFYGATAGNGADSMGTLFKVTADGKLSTLVEFSGRELPNKGAVPSSALIQGVDGHFYGTTAKGGAADLGTVFKLGGDGVFSTLAEFGDNSAPNKGATPLGSLVQGIDGDFYGTTSKGGAADFGTVFKITPAGSLTTLLEFSSNGTLNKGAAPSASLIQAADGNFYGTTRNGGARDFGTLFRMTPAGVLTTLLEFADAEPGHLGAYPCGALAMGGDGSLYGTTTTGGLQGNGTVFKFTPEGALVTLVDFGAPGSPAKGAYPEAALVFGSDGFLYGTTGFGGSAGAGTVFKVSTVGAFITLSDLNLGGAYPESALVFGTDGNLYGTTSGGGAGTAGSVFKVRIRSVPVTGNPGNVQSTSAHLNASINGGSLEGRGGFEFGVSTAYGSMVDMGPLGAGWKTLSADLSHLLPNTTYHFRAVAVDSMGTVAGPDQTFTTGPALSAVLATGDTVAGEPGTTRLLDFGIPSIGDNASTAVLASLSTAEGKVTAILAGSPPTIVARSSGEAPGASGDTVANRRFVSFSDPVCDKTGSVAFVAKIVQGSESHTGIWTNGSGVLKEVALSGAEVAGAPGAQFKAFNSLAMSGTGTLFFVGTVAGSTTGASAGLGLWSHAAGASHLLVRQGEPLLASTVASFNVLGSVAGSPGQGRAFRDDQISLQVTLANRSQAIVHFGAGLVPQVVAASGDPLSDLLLPSVLQSFGIPSVSPGGSSAFRAQLVLGAGGVGRLSDQAIFADSASSNLDEVIRKGAAAPKSGGATFGALSDPVYNAQLKVAFYSTLTGTGVTSKNAQSIWWTSPTWLKMMARTGNEAAGVIGATWSAFDSLALPDGAGPVFVAKLAPGTAGKAWPDGINAANNMGVWATDTAGYLRLVLRTGDQVESGGLNRTISLLSVLGPVLGSPGQARAYNGMRELVCRATFTDHSQAVIRLRLP